MARAVLLDRRLRRRDGAETQFVAADALYAAWRRRDGTVFRTYVAALTVWKQGTGAGQRGITPSAMLSGGESIMCGHAVIQPKYWSSIVAKLSQGKKHGK